MPSDPRTREIHKRIGALALEAAEVGRDRFLARHPEPMVLVFRAVDKEEDHAAFQTMATTLSDASGPLGSMVSLDTPVWRVRKLTDAFPGKVMAGRAPNTDIVVIDPGVSKLHGWFTERDGQYQFTDAGSRNGTTVGEERLTAMEPVTLTDGTAIRLGPGVELLFFEPETIWSMCGQLAP